jgi:glycerophosphoryl diester phosphodiesterase
MLQLKQRAYPVLLIHAAKREQDSTDYRTHTLAPGILHCRKNHLFGVVSHTTALVSAPRIILPVHRANLVLLTYGSNNNSLADVLQQYESGVDTVISDHVGYVNQGLARASREEAAYLY